MIRTVKLYWNVILTIGMTFSLQRGRQVTWRLGCWRMPVSLFRFWIVRFSDLKKSPCHSGPSFYRVIMIAQEKFIASLRGFLTGPFRLEQTGSNLRLSWKGITSLCHRTCSLLFTITVLTCVIQLLAATLRKSESYGEPYRSLSRRRIISMCFTWAMVL